mmetsp:Transcript_65837/g.208368  ORF Transcript_65837/g.208368 Transcript_65837/m.208368 type:complete len:233 (+) Transcript_65837:48-746(+)|eukprot:CAMPEP_0182909058 /NCGR_PEP_ID=MMETSP0034_2-20130328/35546_1 /TAXON_ID=156128 /ORGANISM="Nephroselmis pyriformis, Strain CCMP717" /LENGTH=232 /DNA_ID=CAMNT_0025045283 /DNA_START=48 /DNA_END=746 /DNA_ORIENTATION=+
MTMRLNAFAGTASLLLLATALSFAGAQDEACTMTSPTQRSGQTMVQVEADALLMFGGLGTGGSPRNDLWLFNITTDAWEKLIADSSEDEFNSQGSPTPRVGHTAAVLGPRMYVFGGFNGDLGNFNDVWFYEKNDAVGWRSGLWRQVAVANSTDNPVIGERSGHSMYAAPGGDSFLVFGGNLRNDLWRFNIATSMWTRVIDEQSCQSAASLLRAPLVVAVVAAGALLAALLGA